MDPLKTYPPDVPISVSQVLCCKAKKCGLIRQYELSFPAHLLLSAWKLDFFAMKKISRALSKVSSSGNNGKKAKKGKKGKSEEKENEVFDDDFVPHRPPSMKSTATSTTGSSSSSSSSSSEPGLLRALSMLSDPQTGGDMAAAAESIVKLCTWATGRWQDEQRHRVHIMYWQSKAINCSVQENGPFSLSFKKVQDRLVP